MNFPFDHSEFPLARYGHEVVPLLRNEMSRAVTLRDPDWESDLADIRQGITFIDDPALAHQYKSGFDHQRKEAGANQYDAPFTADDFLREAEDACVRIDGTALDAMTRHAERLREIYTGFYSELSGEANPEIFGHILFTPPGGDGRATYMHVDTLPCLMHSNFKGTGLAIHTGNMLPDGAWEDMNSRNFAADEAKICTGESLMDRLAFLRDRYLDEFSDACNGDVVIMRGQYGRNLEEQTVRRTVAVHTSSPRIPQTGQAGVLFYPNMG